MEQFSDILGGLFWLIFLALVYALPALVAWQRQHHSTAGIVVLNLFLGWTLLGWVLALVWACSAVWPQHGTVPAENRLPLA
jgi:hypothetical protein